MIKELIHDPIFLAGKSEVATKEDLQVAQDLLDTLIAHRESCVGMAANMIGVRKRIIAFLDESGGAPTYTVMLNPEINVSSKSCATCKSSFVATSDFPARNIGSCISSFIISVLQICIISLMDRRKRCNCAYDGQSVR